MESLSARTPRRVLYDLTSVFVRSDLPEGSTIELIITLNEQELNVRELSTYLALADRVYGTILRHDLRRYAHVHYGQLDIREIRKGSIEVVISESSSNLMEAASLIALFVFLRYLLESLKTISETKKNFADSYKSSEEAKLAKENRKKLKRERKRDEFLESLTDPQREQLIEMLSGLREKEQRRLPASKRFARKNVQDVRLVVNKKKRNE